MSLLKAHNYRGNIRELRNILSRAVVLTNTNVIDPAVIRQCLAISEAKTRPASNLTLKAMEEHYLRRLMQEHHDDKDKVAAIAGISVRSLYRKLQEANNAHGCI
jgi:DNA-binding NtrC family response regulator